MSRNFKNITIALPDDWPCRIKRMCDGAHPVSIVTEMINVPSENASLCETLSSQRGEGQVFRADYLSGDYMYCFAVDSDVSSAVSLAEKAKELEPEMVITYLCKKHIPLPLEGVRALLKQPLPFSEDDVICAFNAMVDEGVLVISVSKNKYKELKKFL